MAETSDLERAIAALVLGGLPPADEARVRQRLQKDPAARRLEGQMRETLEALREWRQAHATLPPPAVPPARRSPARILIPLAAAAAVTAAVGAWLLTPGTPTPDLSGELAWTSAPASPPKEMWVWKPAAPRPPEIGPLTGGPGAPPSGGPRQGGGGYGAAQPGGPRPGAPDGAEGGPRTGVEEGGRIGGPPPRAGESGGSKAGAAPRRIAGAPPRDLAAFVRQFDFPFRAPEELPGGWKLAQASPHGKSRLRLAYEAGERRTEVYLAASPGADVAPRPAGSLVAARRRGVLVAFSREAFPGDHWDRVVEEFLK